MSELQPRRCQQSPWWSHGKNPSAIKSFRKTHCTIQSFWTSADGSETSVVLEVAIYYPDGLHDQHRLSVGSHEKTLNWRFWKLATKYNDLRSGLYKNRNKNLVQILHDKSIYTLHYLTLKLHVSSGSHVKKTSSSTTVQTILLVETLYKTQQKKHVPGENSGK